MARPTRIEKSYRVGELEALFLIQVEILVRGDCKNGSGLELVEQLQVMQLEVIYCISAIRSSRRA